jgi:predicted secreted protein
MPALYPKRASICKRKKCVRTQPADMKLAQRLAAKIQADMEIATQNLCYSGAQKRRDKNDNSDNSVDFFLARWRAHSVFGGRAQREYR